MKHEPWFTSHSYLRPLAEFHAQVELAAANLPLATAILPDWDGYLSDFRRGVPLLRSSGAAISLEPAEGMIVSMIENMAASSLPDQLKKESQTLAARVRHPSNQHHVLGCLLGDEEFASANLGLLQYLGWTTLARYLRSVTEAFRSWRDEERWLRDYCPTCGSLPAMAQLVGNESGRLRLLSCGFCLSRWRYPRIACPFCEAEGDLRLESIIIEGEVGLRIDYCSFCRGYLKTYVGQGDEALLLADWTSLHVDVIARDQGLKRLAASLYEL